MSSQQGVREAVEKLLSQASAHDREGNQQAALLLYRSALKISPDDAKSHYRVGQLLLSRDIKGALVHLYKAWQLEPGQSAHWTAVALALGKAGRYEEARNFLSQGQRKGLPEEVVQEVRDKLSIAETLRLDAPALTPTSDDSVTERQKKRLVGLYNAGRYPEAERFCGQLLEHYPGSAFLHKSMGAILSQQGRSVEAVAELRKALELNGGEADTWNTLGTALYSLEKYDEALWAYEQALSIKPRYALALSNKGNALCELGRLTDAVKALKRAVTLQPRFGEALSNLANCYRDLGDLQRAHHCLRKALRYTDRREVLHNFAANLLGMGAITEGLEALNRILDRHPDDVNAISSLTTYQPFSPGDQAIAVLDDALADRQRSLDERIRAGFALGKLCLDWREDEKAFEYYSSANRLAWQTRRTKSSYAAASDRLREFFSEPFFQSRAGWGHASRKPLLITGMPRSGKTLLEQWLGVRPDVLACGETEYFPECLELGGHISQWMQRAAEMGTDDAVLAGRCYEQSLGENVEGVNVLIDTMPSNLWRLGLLGITLPNAPVILCDRNPGDLLVSCYFKHFRTGHGYAYELAALLEHIEAARALMRHWMTVLPNPVLQIPYEDMVQRPMDTLERVRSFLALEGGWEAEPWAGKADPRTDHLGPGGSLEAPVAPRTDMCGIWRRFESSLPSDIVDRLVALGA